MYSVEMTKQKFQKKKRKQNKFMPRIHDNFMLHYIHYINVGNHKIKSKVFLFRLIHFSLQFSSEQSLHTYAYTMCRKHNIDQCV